MEIKTLHDFVNKECGGNIMEAARRLDFDQMQIRRWIKGRTKAGRSSRIIAISRGVRLP